MTHIQPQPLPPFPPTTPKNVVFCALAFFFFVYLMRMVDLFLGEPFLLYRFLRHFSAPLSTPRRVEWERSKGRVEWLVLHWPAITIIVWDKQSHQPLGWRLFQERERGDILFFAVSVWWSWRTWERWTTIHICHSSNDKRSSSFHLIPQPCYCVLSVR